MKLILDEGVPLRTASMLREANIDARHILEMAMAGASDTVILDLSRHDHAVLVTLDADFHQILAETCAASPSIICVRIDALPPAQLTKLLLEVLERTGPQLEAGAAASVTGRRIRLRKLPIKS